MARLFELGITEAAARVTVGKPTAEGLYGDEHVRVYPRLIFPIGLGGGGGGFGRGGGGLGGGGGALGIDGMGGFGGR